MKIRKLTNEEIKGACAFAVSIYNIAIRGCFRTQDCHRYFDEYMDADRLTDEERTGVLVVFGAFDSNVLCGVCGMTVSDSVLIPIECSGFSLQGMQNLLLSIRDISENTNEKLVSNRTVEFAVHFIIRIKQIQRNTSYIYTPYVSMNIIIQIRNVYH